MRKRKQSRVENGVVRYCRTVIGETPISWNGESNAHPTNDHPINEHPIHSLESRNVTLYNKRVAHESSKQQGLKSIPFA